MDLAFSLKTLTLLLGFYMAWNIGANDVANAMGTSVGSKALSLKRAVLLAALLEFSGAFFGGSHVTETIQKGIIDPQIFAADPMIFVLGMMGSLLATGILLQIASYLGLPISTTHAIVGAVLGFGAAAGGLHAVHWNVMGWIALSWIISPLLSGITSYFIFYFIQKKILNSSNPMKSIQRIAPYLVFLCLTIVTLSVFYNGPAPLALNFSFSTAFLICSLIGFIAALLSARLIQKIPETAFQLVSGSQQLDQKIPFDISINQHQGVERIFVFLQILSACLVAFAHGTNDIANAIGPVAAVLGVLKTKTIAIHSTIPFWLLALGGSGIVIGLATWGWRVIETIGKKITELTPSRGFAAEFGAAATILFASKLGLPISTTHALVGAVFGVGIARGINSLNLKMLEEIAISWIVTIPLCAFLSIGTFYFLKWIFLQQT